MSHQTITKKLFFFSLNSLFNSIVCVVLFVTIIFATIYESFIYINPATAKKIDSSSNTNFIKVKHHLELHQISTIDNNNLRTDAARRITEINSHSLDSKLGNVV